MEDNGMTSSPTHPLPLFRVMCSEHLTLFDVRDLMPKKYGVVAG